MVTPRPGLALALCALAAACTGESPPRATSAVTAAAPTDALGTDGRPEARLEGPWGRLAVDRERVLRWRSPWGTRVLDDHVVPELARSPDGARVAWPRRRGDVVEVVAWAPPDGALRVASEGLAVADRPVFAPDGTLYFWGSDARTPLAGLYRATPAGPARVTNRGLARADDPRFVPPPVDFASARFVGPAVLAYVGPAGLVTVNVNEAAP